MRQTALDVSKMLVVTKLKGICTLKINKKTCFFQRTNPGYIITIGDFSMKQSVLIKPYSIGAH